MKNKSLQTLGDEIEGILETKKENVEKSLFMLSPRRCGLCSRPAKSAKEYNSLYEKGVCTRCDKDMNNLEYSEGYTSVKDWEESQL